MKQSIDCKKPHTAKRKNIVWKFFISIVLNYDEFDRNNMDNLIQQID